MHDLTTVGAEPTAIIRKMIKYGHMHSLGVSIDSICYMGANSLYKCVSKQPRSFFIT